MSADIRCRASYMPGHLRPRSTVHLPAEHSLPVARSQAGVQAGRRFSVLYSLSLAFLVWMLLATPLHALTSEEKELWLAAQEVELLLSDESAPESDPVNDSYSVRSYQVEAGDTLSAIAARFGISRQTIIWANPELHQNPDLLQIGQELIILPVDGAYHKVQAQDTLWDLSHRYGVEIEDIVAYPGNKLLNPEILTLGQKLIIPGQHKSLLTHLLRRRLRRRHRRQRRLRLRLQCQPRAQTLPAKEEVHNNVRQHSPQPTPLQQPDQPVGQASSGQRAAPLRTDSAPGIRPLTSPHPPARPW